jgi:hypothetical protein
LPSRGPAQELCGLSEPAIDLSHESWCPDLDSNRAPPEYKARASPLDQPVRYIGTYRSYASLTIKPRNPLLPIPDSLNQKDVSTVKVAAANDKNRIGGRKRNVLSSFQHKLVYITSLLVKPASG